MSIGTRPISHFTTSGSIRDRILADVAGPRDEALVFAASSINRELMAPAYAGGAVIRELSTEQGTYTLRGSRVFGPNGPQPAIIVYAREAAGAPPVDMPEDRLRVRFYLTRKEARVAVLLAAYKSNEQIAAELFISPHTARHHTQSVLGKLGVRSRRDVADVLRSS